MCGPVTNAEDKYQLLQGLPNQSPLIPFARVENNNNPAVEPEMVHDTTDLHLDLPRASIAHDVVEETSSSLHGAVTPPDSCFIFRIPTEVLGEIFCWVPLLSRDPLKRDPCAFMHVCGQWRQVALRKKDCWTTLPMCNLGWTMFALDHSQPSLITVRAPSYNRRNNVDVALKASLGNLSRVRQIMLHVPERRRASRLLPSNAKYILSLLEAHPAPDLETICIDVDERHAASFAGLHPNTGRRLRTVDLRHTLPRSSMSGLFSPSVTTLALDPGAGSHMTHLSLSNPLPAESRPRLWATWESFLDCLDTMPILESLLLRGDLLPRDDAISAQPVAVRFLPALRILEVHDSLKWIAILLTRVSLPSRANVHLKSCLDGDISATALALSFNSCLTRDVMPSFEHLTFTIDATSKTRSKSHCVNATFVDTSVSPEVVFSLDLREATPTWPPVCQKFVLETLTEATFFSGSLRKLTLDFNMRYWSPLMQKLTKNVQSLEVRSFEGLVGLSIVARHTSKPPLFRHLRTLWLPPFLVWIRCVVEMRDELEWGMERPLQEYDKEFLDAMLVDFASLVGATDVQTAPEHTLVYSEAVLDAVIRSYLDP
ncbi:hypothetical protein BV25DRAFT_1988449 [Artomyces pyxidatus]|uniref:Uncharacterized protein n=1 Tax=Artomyces pyxidatus TaxID=48021 RepID=A0ACB8TE62_9AGAM|nr:hypothetical protein BV25DRAFT_1988449 [Artomyces pyxidatus]